MSRVPDTPDLLDDERIVLEDLVCILELAGRVNVWAVEVHKLLTDDGATAYSDAAALVRQMLDATEKSQRHEWAIFDALKEIRDANQVDWAEELAQTARVLAGQTDAAALHWRAELSNAWMADMGLTVQPTGEVRMRPCP